MADFVAVLKKTIDGLGEATPETRARVYDKARATIGAKLAAINPPPPQSVIDRQKASLEQAIKQIEAEFAAPKASEPPIDDFEAIMKSLEAPVKITPPPPLRPTAPAPAAPKVEAKPAAPAPEKPGEPKAALPEALEEEPDADLVQTAPDRLNIERTEPRPVPRRAFLGRIGLAACALIVLVFAGAAGYALWTNRGEVSVAVGLGDNPSTAEAPPAKPVEPAPQVAATEPAAPAPQPQPSPAAPAAPEVQKFTQKLNPDGTEVDEGPAGGNPGVGEGTSVAALTVQPPGSEASAPNAVPAEGQPAASPATAQAAPAATEQTAPSQADGVPVGQRAIFYEERTASSGGSAETGSTVWSLVQESPGGDLPAEPAVRADVTIPGKEVQLRMTIRRNGDPTLPASHIIELIFLTPDNFEGGVIDNLLRMTMKETEEATGNPLLGVPAKIGDGFFLIALSDGKPEQEANMQLFRRMKWIDIPIVYRSGRRALMTLERGIPGDKIFEEAIKAWSQLPATNG